MRKPLESLSENSAVCLNLFLNRQSIFSDFLFLLQVGLNLNVMRGCRALVTVKVSFYVGYVDHDNNKNTKIFWGPYWNYFHKFFHLFLGCEENMLFLLAFYVNFIQFY